MSDLKSLYASAIVEHSRTPRNNHRPGSSNRNATGHNPLCGDKFNLFLYIDNHVIREIGFTGSGCAIATASASMMTEALKGKTDAEARTVFAQFTGLLTGNSAIEPAALPGDLSLFSGVRGYPARIKCATLIWHTLQAALEGQKNPVATE